MGDSKTVLEGHAEGSKTLGVAAVKANRRLEKRMPWTTLTRLERLDAVLPEDAHDGFDTRVDRVHIGGAEGRTSVRRGSVHVSL